MLGVFGITGAVAQLTHCICPRDAMLGQGEVFLSSQSRFLPRQRRQLRCSLGAKPRFVGAS